jgi:hypothetical protein
MNDLLRYLLPFLAFLFFFALIRRQERRTGKPLASSSLQFREQARDPRSLFAMASVVAVFLVYVAIAHPASWWSPGYGALLLLVVTLVAAGVVAGRRGRP